MSLPEDPLIWGLVVAGLVVVALVALFLGGQVEIGLDPPRLKFLRKSEGPRERVSVLEAAEIERAEVGDVSGVEAGGDAGEAGQREVEVAKGVKITGSKVGDISGVRIAPKSDPPASSNNGAG